jgi:hypothetical protein
MPGCAVYRYFHVRVTRESRPWRKTLRELEAFASEPHRASQLVAIPDEAYAAGVLRLREEAERAGGGDAPVESDFVLVTIAGDRAITRSSDRAIGHRTV